MQDDFEFSSISAYKLITDKKICLNYMKSMENKYDIKLGLKGTYYYSYSFIRNNIIIFNSIRKNPHKITIVNYMYV